MKGNMTGISIIVPAYNEEENIISALAGIFKLAERFNIDYEIIVVNDGSRDNTGYLINQFVKRHANVKVIHHKENLGFGKAFRSGIALSTKAYITGFPGDNDASPNLLANLLGAREKAELVISYPSDHKRRTIFRRFVSKSFVFFMNTVFGLRLKYYNGYLLAKSENLKSLPLKSDGLVLFAEIIVRLVKSGKNYHEVPFTHTGRKYGRSKAITLRSFLSVTKTFFLLLKDIYFA